MYGCGCKEVYRFPHTIYLSLLLLYNYNYLFFFAAASLLFVHVFLVPVLFVIKFYVLNNSFVQYKRTYGRPTAAI